MNKKSSLEEVIPVILSGGSGTRLWPLSREHYPKQLLSLINDNTLLQDTFQRLNGLNKLSKQQIIVCNEEHRFLVAEQLRQLNSNRSLILLEPEGRNTAPALTLAALSISNKQEDGVMLVLPADHAIINIPAYHKAVQDAYHAAQNDKLVTFGIKPDSAETGFGYIKVGQALSDFSYELSEFVEKPNLQTAQDYLASGNYVWNSGMFMMKASVWLQQIKLLCPSILTQCEKAISSAQNDNDFCRVNREHFLNCESDSIDYAVMEKISDAVVVNLDAGWSDLGSWTALWDVSKKDENDNVVSGDIFIENTKNSYVKSNNKLVAALGLEDTIIVETSDAVLVAHKNYAQDVKKIVTWLKNQGRDEQVNHPKVYRPWGCYESIDTGERFQVKRITVNKGATLSLQLHHHRAEHWVVVKGTAKVTRGDEQFLVTENQSTYIPLGVKHRLENTGSIPLEMIEVQSGSYLGEDDIVRFDDRYGRVEKIKNM
ncbi:Mannose-1-phosphate guanylyltransferase / Mannose-6-phosphate isomerase [hydrothermal vent metagenome]|uniref:mannose-1-phosphate guanylyltransferase n=1 Tax=hydrothermal vent metagenome TaxID=652676 RepID=A0A3B1A0K5_9ZZZZ